MRFGRLLREYEENERKKREEAIRQGLQQGLQQGIQQATLESAKKVVKEFGISPKEVAEKFGISLELLKKSL